MRLTIACLRSTAVLFGLCACAPASAPSANATSALRIARIDATASAHPGAAGAALREHGEPPLAACWDKARATGAATAGHMDLSVAVDEKGATMAAVMHTTFSDYAITECVARALSGAALPNEGASYRIRVRLESGG